MLEPSILNSITTLLEKRLLLDLLLQSLLLGILNLLNSIPRHYHNRRSYKFEAILVFMITHTLLRGSVEETTYAKKKYKDSVKQKQQILLHNFVTNFLILYSMHCIV